MIQRFTTFVVLLLSLTRMRTESAASTRDEAFFGLTNLWTLHITVTPKAWKELGGTELGPRGGGNRGGGGFFESLFGGPARPSGVNVGPGGREYPWSTCTLEAAGMTLTNVGVRFKGHSSFVRAPNGFKRPFKLDFNRNATNQRFLGLEEITLNNNVNDATQMREALAYQAFRQAGIPAPRTAFARVLLTITGQFERRLLGLYTVIEPVNKEFLNRQLGSKSGLLLKPEMMPGLVYFGEDWDAYVERYGPKGKVAPGDTRRMVEFARFIQESDPAEFSNRLGQFLEPTAFMRFVALNSILANLDSFIGNGHNYYLYIDSTSRRAQFIPWDVNEAFGMHPVSGPSGEQMIFNVLRPNADPNRLVERVVTDPRLGSLYRAQCAALLTNVFEPRRIHQDIDRIAAVTWPVVEKESRRARADFRRTVLETLAPNEGELDQPRHDRELSQDGYQPWGFPDAVHIDNIPLKKWVTGRHANVKAQLEGQIRGKRPRARLNN